MELAAPQWLLCCISGTGLNFVSLIFLFGPEGPVDHTAGQDTEVIWLGVYQPG